LVQAILRWGTKMISFRIRLCGETASQELGRWSLMDRSFNRAQALILGVLVILGIYAMTFTPYEAVFAKGVWGTDFRLDPQFRLRATLIGTGLAGAALSVLVLLLAFSLKVIRGDEEEGDFPLQAAVTLVSMSIGWLAFPYWVNGVFQAFTGNRAVLARMPVLDFDPKALMPASWLGGCWWWLAFFLFYLLALGIPVLALTDLAYALWTRRWRQAGLIACCLAVVSAIVYLQPNFGGWLAD
jgi:hypothetical protein